MIPITDLAGWQALSALPCAILLKHGARCPISAHARDELTSFEEAHALPPVYVLEVTEHRELSQTVADAVGIEHESPQVILLRDGRPEWHATHYEIRADDVATRAASRNAGR